MTNKGKLVAVISPWSKLSELVRANFRIESLVQEKKVLIWRDDLQTAETLTAELRRLGVQSPEVRTENVTAKWQEID